MHDIVDGRPSGLMVADIGALNGIVVSSDVPPEDYEDIREKPPEYWAYSPIPETFVEQVNTRAGGTTVRHVAFQSMPGNPRGEFDEEEYIESGESPTVSPTGRLMRMTR